MDDLRWWHLAICQGMPTNLFYDDYEENQILASNIDEICLSCPVRSMCLRDGVENNETGVWGGVYLERGKADKMKNNHKTDDIWEIIRGDIDG